MRIFGTFVVSMTLALGAFGCVGAPDDDIEDEDGELGVAESALLATSNTAVNFGGVPVGCAARGSVTITNNSTAYATITSITTTNAVFTTGTFPTSLAPGASATLGIRFTPTAETSYTANLTIASREGIFANPNLVINLSGTGFPPDPC